MEADEHDIAEEEQEGNVCHLRRSIKEIENAIFFHFLLFTPEYDIFLGHTVLTNLCFVYIITIHMI